MSENRPDPGLIMQLATGYWNSATLLAANDLNLFGLLADGARTVEQIAQQLQTTERAASMLLDACVGLGLVEKQQENAHAVYMNAPDTSAFLVPGRAGYLGDAIKWAADQYAAWGLLANAVRASAPVVSPEEHLGDSPEQTRRFVMGMHNRALGVARGVLRFLDFEGVAHLLDIGGGPGTYAMLLAQKYPGLKATVLDLPGVVAIAGELIAQAGLAERVHTLAGDATTADYNVKGIDGILFSGVLHQMSAATIQQMFARAFQALPSAGRVIVSDIMLDTTKTQPTFATLFGLQMLLTSHEGVVFSAAECAEWLTQAGFTDVQAQTLPPPLPYVVITAQKP